MKLILTLSLCLFAYNLQAKIPLPQGASPERLEDISKSNQAQALQDQSQLRAFEDQNKKNAYDGHRADAPVIRPFAEYEKTGYIFFNDGDYRKHATAIKKGIAENLPEDVTLVVYTTSSNKFHAQRVKERYKNFVKNESQLIVLQIPASGSSDFWTRDNLPLPVWTDEQLTLVDARYYYNFEPDRFLVDLFDSLYSQHRYFFEGGNFIANSRGECIVVNRRRSYPGGTSDTAAIPDAIFKKHYGCQKLLRLRHLKGIGHSDEVVKFMTDDIVVTDTHQYVDSLKAMGYQVHLLPEPDRNYETYVNSLQVNNTLFVPIFDEVHDQKAIDAYKKLNLGLKIVTLPTRRLAINGQGGIHCITMNYPPAPLKEMIEALNATTVE